MAAFSLYQITFDSHFLLWCRMADPPPFMTIFTEKASIRALQPAHDTVWLISLDDLSFGELFNTPYRQSRVVGLDDKAMRVSLAMTS